MIEIKKAGIENIGLIQSLAHQIWPVAYKDIISPDQTTYMLNLIYSTDALKTAINDKQHAFIIAYKGSIPVGFASYGEREDEPGKFHLHKLYLHPSQQGQGAGKTLLNGVLDAVKAQGATHLSLNVNRHNPAVQFYKKMGFTTLRSEDNDIGNGYFMNDYVMELPL